MRNLFLAILLLAATPAYANIKIAVVGPMTGPQASVGEQMRRGAEVAVAEINKNGGVNGEQVELLVGDDVCDPKQAVSVANQMVGKGAVMIAGHYCSGSSIPASAVYADEGILQISPASTNPKLTEQGFENVFRVCGRDDQQGPVAAQYMLKNFSGKRFAVMHDKSAAGKGIAEQVNETLTKAGQKPAMFDSYTAGEKDYRAVVSRLQQANVDVLYVGGYHTEIGLIIRQMREAGVKTQVIGNDSMNTTEFWAITGPAGEGALMTFGPDPRDNKASATYVKALRKQGFEPEGYTLYTVAAIQIWQQAAAAAKSTKLADVTGVMHKTDFATVMGELSFDDKGDIKQPAFTMYKWSKGSFKDVGK